MPNARRTPRRTAAVASTLTTGPGGRVWVYVVVLVIAAVVSYSNALDGPFLLDDSLSIVGNPSIRRLDSLVALIFPDRELPVAGRPLVNISFALNYAVHGLEVRGFHVVNVALHVLCGLTLFGLARRTLLAPAIRERLGRLSSELAFATSLIWLVHPLNTEAVNYLTQRTELLMGLFYLLTLYAFARAHESPGPYWYLTSVVSCAAGMACKESMVTAPVVALLYDRVFWCDSFASAILARWRVYVGLAGAWILLGALMWTGPRVHSVGFGTNVSAWTYLLNQAELVSRYLSLAVWPRALVINYGNPKSLVLADVFIPGLFILALGAATVTLLVKRPTLGFLGAWFFITLAPTSSVVPIATEVGAERRMYLPLAGLLASAIVGATVFWLRAKGNTGSTPRRGAIVGWCALVAVVTALGCGTLARNREYSSDLTMAQTVLERWPSGVARHMVGLALVLQGRREEGIAYLREATTDDPKAHFALGQELFRDKNYAEAIVQLEAFARKQPMLLEVVSARMTMGLSFLQLKQYPASAREFARVLAMVPSHTDAHLGLGDALFRQEKYEEALSHYQTYLSRRPGSSDALTTSAIALAALGRTDEALTLFRTAAQLHPGDGGARRNLANALLARERFDDAIAQAQRAITLDPEDAVSRDILGLAYMGSRRAVEAVAQFREAVRLDPDNAEYRDHLAGAQRVLESIAAR